MRTVGWICVALSLALPVMADSAVAADADVIRDFGILGRNAIDCAAPFGRENPYVIYAITPTGEVTRTLKMVAGAAGTFVIRNLRTASQNTLQYDETGTTSMFAITLIKQNDGTLRSWRSVQTSGSGKVEILIEDGKFKSSGRDTPAFNFCDK